MKNSGQSLVEVIIAVGAMSLLMVALLALVSLSIRSNRLSQSRAEAVALAEEGIELMRAYRDLSWTDLYDKDGNNYGLEKNWTVESDFVSCPVINNIDDFFIRCVDISNIGGTINIKVTVSWQEGSQIMSTKQTSQLSLWER
jgi:hypothetical protein